MEGPLILLHFLGIFSHIIGDNSCLNCCISIKLLQSVCLINIHILVYGHSDLIASSENLSTIWYLLKIQMQSTVPNNGKFFSFFYNFPLSFSTCIKIQILWTLFLPVLFFISFLSCQRQLQNFHCELS